MKLFGWQRLAASSLLLTALAVAETRPQYGGRLRVSLREAMTSLDPAGGTSVASFARRNLTLLIFDTLTTIDDRGELHPALATSWQAAPGNQRWQLRLRQGVKFHDGALLTSDNVASCLRTANPSWKVFVDGDFLVIERDTPDPNLPAKLTLSHNAIAKKDADGKLSGTGPFHIADWQPGKKLVLAAEENYWRGRPFLDAIEIEMGKNLRDQLIALEVGGADFVEVGPEQIPRVSMDGARVSSSAPVELVALLFTRDIRSPEEKLLRDALALCVERASIRSVLLQGTGQPTGGLLPNWTTGYGFVFPTDADLPRARQEREQVRTAPNWSVAYDASDSMARLLVERIALNARDAGLVLQPTTAANADLRLVRIAMASSNAWIALTNVAEASGLVLPKGGENSVEDLYVAERELLTTQRLIPLFHLPVTYASAKTLKDWTLGADGSWRLADSWMGERQGNQQTVSGKP